MTRKTHKPYKIETGLHLPSMLHISWCPTPDAKPMLIGCVRDKNYSAAMKIIELHARGEC